MQQNADPLTLALTGQFPLILLVAVFLSAVMSGLLLMAYRRAVIRSMRTLAGTGPATVDRSRLRTPATRADRPPLEISVISGGDAPPANGSGADLYVSARRARLRNATVYAAAGSGYAAVMVACYLISTGTGVFPLRMPILLFWWFFWPAILVLSRVAAVSRKERWLLIGLYLASCLLMGAVVLATSSRSTWQELGGLWAILNLPATILLLGFLRRKVRAVGPLVLAFMVLAVFGSSLAVAIAAADDRLLWMLAGVGTAAGLNATAVLVALFAFGFALWGVVGWMALRWIRYRYEAKKISDQTLTADAIILLFGVVGSIGLVFEGAIWVLSGIAAFLIFKIIAAAGFSRLAGRAERRVGPRLLVLRVFALGRRSERLFDALGEQWRHLGSIQLIAGPDLASTTIEPHEFLDFLSRRLDRRFIDGADALRARMAELDLLPDRDGRFRVHDFFCYYDAWRMVLERLVGESDAILMDLRGFSRENAGCLFEIEELINAAPLERVVMLIDDATDLEFLRASVQRFWKEMRPGSPNQTDGPGRLVLHHSPGSGAGSSAGLLRDLCAGAAASRVRPPRVDSGAPGVMLH